ncbi:MAG: AMP-binding protein [Cyclobacteriaceae bacterium]|nr:AMP-binding protein [Cyclobacteriaceae bacterium]
MPWLLENGKRYSFNEIKNGVAESSSAIIFCSDWLNEKEKFVLQTSGSTGAPKRIEVTRYQLKASARITAEYLNLKPEETALVCLEVAFVAGLMMLVRAMETGMNIIVTPPQANPLQLVAHLQIDFTALVPYQVETILNSPQREKLHKIRNVLIGGAPLSEQTRTALQSFTNGMFATYGMTETLTHIALQKINGTIENTFEVLSGFEIETDHRGCLVITAAHLGPEAVITNDLIERVSKNQFRWLGRIDSVINTGGVKIIPEKVESLIAKVFEKLKITNRFFIAGLPHAQLGESVALIIEAALSAEKTDLVMRELEQNLSRYENPKSIYQLGQFAYTQSGKINRPETITLLKKHFR